jgi:carbon storage regulator
MLVLTRGVNEAIMIGDNVEITVVDVKGEKVRLGIKAPASVPVHRKEVYLAIKQANIEAAQAAPQSLEDLQRLMEQQRKKPGAGPAGPSTGPASPSTSSGQGG